MRKKFTTLVVIAALAFSLSGCNMIRTVQGPDLEKPVFVKMLIYENDMDVDLHYICNEDWEKMISKVEIPDAPENIDCVVYDEEEEYDGKYKVVTAHIGINDDRWEDEKGLPEDISINQMKITWDDGTTTTEDLGNIVIASEKIDYNNSEDVIGNEGPGEYYISLGPVKERTEITGFEVPFKDIDKIINEIYINEKPLSDINIRNPLVIRKGESFEIYIDIDPAALPEYGEIWAAAKVLKKSGDREVKYTNVLIGERFYAGGKMIDYLKAVLK